MKGSVLNKIVSAYRNYGSVKPVDVNLLTWLHSTKFKAQVDAIRATEDKSVRDLLKAQLPAITPSGKFSKRCKDGLLEHSGLMQADIDLHHNEDVTNFNDLKIELSKLPEIAYCGLSVSGRGFWLLIPIQFPSKHDYHFEALRQDFKGLGIEIDATPDVCRLRGYSYDCEAYFNHTAKVYRRYIEPQPERYERSKKQFIQTNESTKVETILKQIELGRIDITPTYHDWFAIGCALASEFGENGRDYFHRVSQFHPKYGIADTDKQFNHCKGGTGYRIGTFYEISERYGLYYKHHLRVA